MQVVILAAGRGVRMMPLTADRPKPLVLLGGKPLIQHTLEQLPETISEIIFVVGYLGDHIKQTFGNTWKGIPITYVEQSEPKGTFHALKQAKNILKNRFMVLMADDLYAQADLESLLVHDAAILVQKVTGPSEKYGVVLTDANMGVTEIIEKQPGLTFTYANCGAYKMPKAIFDEPIIFGPTGEEYLSSMVGTLAKKMSFRAVVAGFWFPIANPEDIEKAGEII
ncbi:MAG: bifunctional UDP-N-acetylglucosamine pyrophosphorylase / Glucosamine-1-phosphate N-acetyltransferase [Parcubacteria group bacterium Gr01-1014_18]|nr:MAG: bifunctional UDP-N-acetylglucosamine pyrophosphorylase / Glucosamine-1-phosphate N-acetyltransferase [Parcubacteria group bacterium Greene0416_36]TSC81325.1 MAG: bifunctional UDP-N-acetylglucosamine pyrophosphorylase / Glucosamine-1-phosphate N-acetyltransferase [Parcubacteria group bacterium Gr01-1014_18]TSC99489.1 MAG: bifunctional UDP-N-acetylglucosamine pyrophosphorylase / Glucosamine-1-phosphate N-acetyltransferase [Parcubacteria group bacterium Greene1014_20]TSD07592.1 MAG: bifunct